MKSKCPICKKQSSENYMPFCSQRCKNVDLAHWLKGDYFIPGEDDETEKKKDENHNDE